MERPYQINVNITPFRMDHPLIVESEKHLKDGNIQESNMCLDKLMDGGERQIREKLDLYPDLKYSIERTKSTFIDYSEPSFNINIEDPKGEYLDQVKGLFAVYANEEKQQNYHIIEASDKPHDIDYGQVQKQGYSFEPAISIDFVEPLTSNQVDSLQKLMTEINLDGSQLNQDNTSLKLYNITKICNEQVFQERSERLIRELQEGGFSFNVFTEDVKLWNYGEKAHGATRSIQEVANYHQKTEGKIDLLLSLKGDKDNLQTLVDKGKILNEFNSILFNLNQSTRSEKNINLDHVFKAQGFDFVQFEDRHFIIKENFKIDVSNIVEKMDNYKSFLLDKKNFDDLNKKPIPKKVLGIFSSQKRDELIRERNNNVKPVFDLRQVSFNLVKIPDEISQATHKLKNSMSVKMHIKHDNSFKMEK